MNQQSQVIEEQDIYASERFVYFDIETIPSQDTSLLDEIRKTITPPGNIKKQESIDKWLAENREEKALEAFAKTSFDGGKGHVCTIAWAKNDGEICVHHAHSLDAESSIIQYFFDDLDKFHSETLVGHYIGGFDIPFLLKRAVCLGIAIPPKSTFPRDPKPWDKSIHDTMNMWMGNRDSISMDNLCGILGIKGKEGFDGSMVAAAWAKGEHDKIAEYCKDDIWRTREIHKRFLKAGW